LSFYASIDSLIADSLVCPVQDTVLYSFNLS
jgi:hypothetical protein